MHFSKYKNAVMPAYAALAILFGIAMHELSSASKQDRPELSLPPLVAFLGLAQFVAFAVYRFPYLPKAYDVEAGRKLQAALRAVDGEVFVPTQNMLAVSVGKEPSAQRWAIGDVMRTPGRGRKLLAPEITAALTDRRFAAIVADRESVVEIFGPEIDRTYARRPIELNDPRAQRLFGSPEMYTPRLPYDRVRIDFRPERRALRAETPTSRGRATCPDPRPTRRHRRRSSGAGCSRR